MRNVREEVERLKEKALSMGIDIEERARTKPFESCVKGCQRACQIRGLTFTDAEAVEYVIASGAKERNGMYWTSYEEAMFNRLLETLAWLKKEEDADTA